MIKDELCGWLLLHRRGVMGTVIFHLVLAIAFLGVKISQADVHVEMEIVMEAPDEEEVEQQRAEEQRREEIRQRASGEEVERMLRSIAVNENIEAQSAQPMENISDYIDEIRAELAEAGGDGRYAARRNEHYRSDSLRWAQDREEQALASALLRALREHPGADAETLCAVTGQDFGPVSAMLTRLESADIISSDLSGRCSLNLKND